jgi:hypothetical protein
MSGAKLGRRHSSARRRIRSGDSQPPPSVPPFLVDRPFKSGPGTITTLTVNGRHQANALNRPTERAHRTRSRADRRRARAVCRQPRPTAVVDASPRPEALRAARGSSADAIVRSARRASPREHLLDDARQVEYVPGCEAGVDRVPWQLDHVEDALSFVLFDRPHRGGTAQHPEIREAGRRVTGLSRRSASVRSVSCCRDVAPRSIAAIRASRMITLASSSRPRRVHVRAMSRRARIGGPAAPSRSKTALDC